MEWKLPGRIPLSEGAEIELNGIIIVNDDNPPNVDKGSTCLVYRGHVKSGPGVIPGTPVIIKEFYPESDSTVLDIMREKDENGCYGKLKIHGITKKKLEYLDKLHQFQKGADVQKELAKSTAMEVAIKPWLEGMYGDGYYIISETHAGQDIAKCRQDSLAERLQLAVCVAESMNILHDAGYVMPDFKPENLMYIEKPNNVRIIDTDSLWNFRCNEAKEVYANIKYASPELIDIKIKMEVGERSSAQIEREIQRVMNPIADIYSMGVFFLELFFQWLPELEDSTGSIKKYAEPIEKTIARMKDDGTLLGRFRQIYSNEHISKRKLEDVGRRLIGIIERATYFNRNRRKKEGFDNAFSLMKELSELYYILTSELLVPRKEIAKANGSFAAYNMLQKYPLFDYLTYCNEQKILSVTLAGNHAMMNDMLGAMISIGQMLDTELKIHLTGSGIEEFWNNYTSKDRNEALKRAVVVLKDGKIITDDVDKKLVDRSLATIEIHTQNQEEVVKMLAKEKLSKYFVLMNEDSDDNHHMLNAVSDIVGEDKVFIGYLKLQEDEDYEDNVYDKKDVYGISALSFSSTYNEKMFEERIYRMGLLAHAYYMGYMKENCSVDMEKEEAKFKEDIYSMASSERAALHGIYKMESIGIHRNKPGRIINYYRKICDNDILEKLAWLEHLSWSGYMLTSGAKPIAIEKFGSYAYRENNDWKDKRDKRHLGHPLLAASKPERRVTDDMWEKGFAESEVKELDALDQVSYHIFRWYTEQKESLREGLERFIGEWKTESEEILNIQLEIRESATRLLNEMGKKGIHQNQENVKNWNIVLEHVRFLDEKSYLQLKNMMKPAVDSYKDCDFKGLDRELVFSAVDMLI